MARLAALGAEQRRRLAAWSPTWWRAAALCQPGQWVVDAAAAGRGDVVAAVVVAADDGDLCRHLAALGFDRTVDVYGWPDAEAVVS